MLGGDDAPRNTIYEAFTSPSALVAWQAPGDMTAQVHEFDGQVVGGYWMSLYYPFSEQEQLGKTSNREDQYTSRFVEFTPPSRIVQAITSTSDDPAFAGEMTMTVSFENIPAGIRPEDNDAGTRSSLDKLARYVERNAN